ncbi:MULTISPECIES: site-2 protease family protein [Candidatus Ichthyocystis]|uniref:Peptidase family M50 n=1 Tax=Candidatus Ichthyocystis hellenicum TaxID=1561003 RepID=A0A0S4LZ75_9BURK|nr:MULTISPECIES: site-2 protease family protein [Ichthyocystis]CUT16873.1 Peptidase family M50 [Candidatus Ichthyocystis hellenicum]
MRASISEALGAISVIFLPVVLALTGHEIAHAYAACKFGDDTARRQGRLSFNPLHHIDPLGTVIFPIVFYILLNSMANFPLWFGWAKPIPVNRSKLKGGRYALALVALAGPLANLLMAFIWSIVMHLISSVVDGRNFWVQVSIAGIQVNAVFLAFNLIPILPFDGGRFVHALLPPRWATVYSKTESWGAFAVLFIIIIGYLVGVNVIYFWIAPFYEALLWVFHVIFLGRSG